MIKITGLITEYNPFHNGHLYHLEKSREKTGADYCVALMSGSFVQRGAPAVYDKYVRTAMALSCGVDLVLEMPVAFSTASAREFAACGTALFTALGADGICFGSECGDIGLLKETASLLYEEPEDFPAQLMKNLKSGMTFPRARSSALAPYLPDGGRVLTEPNNILAVEYCRAALALKSPLKLDTVKREGDGYHDTSIEGSLGSAEAIRLALAMELPPSSYTQLVPPQVAELMQKETPLRIDDFSSVLSYRIWAGNFEGISDLAPELANRLANEGLNSCRFEERILDLKSRQFTYTRVSRALLHLLLNMKTSDIEEFKAAGYAPYARVLGFRKEAEPLFTELKKRSSLPLVTKLADASRLLSPTALKMLKQEIDAAHLYQIVAKKEGCVFKNEYTQPVVIV